MESLYFAGRIVAFLFTMAVLVSAVMLAVAVGSALVVLALLYLAGRWLYGVVVDLARR